MRDNIYLSPSRVRPGDRLVTDESDAVVRAWHTRTDGTIAAAVDGALTGTGLSVSGGATGLLRCCMLRIAPHTLLAGDVSCGGAPVGQSGGGPGNHPLTDDAARRLTDDGRMIYARPRPPRVLPPLAWFNSHPTIADPERGGTRLRRCVRCNLRDMFHVSYCEPGLIVHLPDQQAAQHYLYAGVPQATEQQLDGARTYWQRKGFVVVPDPAPERADHPLYRPCQLCNEAAMSAGLLEPLYLPAAPQVYVPEARPPRQQPCTAHRRAWCPVC